MKLFEKISLQVGLTYFYLINLVNFLNDFYIIVKTYNSALNISMQTYILLCYIIPFHILSYYEVNTNKK